MKVYEKIKEFDDAKDMTKRQIIDECYALKYCPLDIENNHDLVGDKKIVELCEGNECDIECLEKYLDIEVQDV